MSILIEPKVNVDDIVFEKDENDQYGTQSILDQWGKNIPIIKIQDYVVNVGDIEVFELHYRLNSLPIFSISLRDENYYVRELLKNDIDKCTIFIGYKNWYIKFNAIITKTFSDEGDPTIELFGKLYNQKLYDTIQKSYTNTTPLNILKDVCTKTGMGLFSVGNDTLNTNLEYEIKTSKNYMEYLEYILKTYTNCLFGFDCFYYMHLIDIDNLRKQKIDKYTLDTKTGENIGEHDIVFKTHMDPENSTDEKEDFRIPVKYYSIDTNYTEGYEKFKQDYFVNNKKLLSVDNGNGIKKTNTFSKFNDIKYCFYDEIINKALSGTIIKLEIENAILELTPFSVVGLDVFLPSDNGRENTYDSEHSGKKIVLSSSLIYNKLDNIINQKLELL